jgi:hypothetical protein
LKLEYKRSDRCSDKECKWDNENAGTDFESIDKPSFLEEISLFEVGIDRKEESYKWNYMIEYT